MHADGPYRYRIPTTHGWCGRLMAMFQTTAAIVLLVTAAQAQSIPLPQAKPGAVVKEKAFVLARPIPQAKPGAADEKKEPEPARPIPPAEPDAAGEAKEPRQANTCLRDLEAAGIIAAPAPDAIPSGNCAMEDAVAVEAVDTPAGKIALPARPVLDCRFAAVLGAWLSEIVSPAGHSLLGSPVEAIATGPGYQCRSRAGGRPSEHAIGNALDISSVRLVDGRSVLVETLPTAKGAEQDFLRAISTSACGYFTTVLGPGSDAAHANHLHVDLAERRTAEYRICMAR